jgi:shikimate dehydrogenase
MSSLTGKTKLLAVIGHPIRHSRSPFIHNAWAEDTGSPYAYLAFDVVPEHLGAFAEAARILPIAGFNLTMPLKELILPYLDVIDPVARACGAVNTVAVREGLLYGYNTDGPGFIRALETLPFTPAGQKVLLLGTGGAAKSVALALAEKGAEVVLASRHPYSLPPLGAGLSCAHWDNLPEAAQESQLLVNATPLGMQGQGQDFAQLDFLAALPPGAPVVDLIYDPPQTRLLQAAKTLGHPTMNGLPHLVYQAALAFTVFTGVSPEADHIENVLRRL